MSRHEVVEVRVLDGALGHVGAFVHHHDAIADPEDVLESVGDEDDAHAAVGDPLDESEDGFDLGHREGRRGLIEDEHPGIERHRTADGDRLPLAARQVGDWQVACWRP